MAISVDLLYQKVEDTLVKNQSGNFNGNEFNLNLRVAQNDIFNFFMQKDGVNSFTHDALQPFITKYTVPITYPIAMPGDYRSKRSSRVRVGVMDGDTPKFSWHTCDFLKTDEEDMTLSSRVRGPSVQKEVYLYTIRDNGINIYPEGLTGTFDMLYLRHPAEATRAFTTDTANEVEVYTPTGTVDLEWGSQYFNMFHEVICFYQGFQVRESEVLSWLSAKRNYDKG